MAKGSIVSKKAIKREPGYLYFVDKQGNVRRVPMKRKAKKRSGGK